SGAATIRLGQAFNGEVIVIVRREFMLGAAASGVLMQPRFGYAKASQPATNVNFDVPAGACDCHTHIHGDPVKFPWFAGRTYTPETALPEEMTAAQCAQNPARGDRNAERVRPR